MDTDEAAAGGSRRASARPDHGRPRRDYVRTDYARRAAQVARVCRRVEAGETIGQACRDPDMPSRSTLVSWAARHPELRTMLEEAHAAAEAAGFVTRRPDYQCWDEALAAELLGRIEDGRGLREVCAEPDMPAHPTVTRWLRERPDFAEAYARAREAQADRLFDLAWRIACEAGPKEVAAARLKIQTIKWRVGKLVPRVYGPAWLAAKAERAQAEKAKAAKAAKAAGPVVIRAWACVPDGRVVEYTEAASRMSRDEERALYDDLTAGRVQPEDVPGVRVARDASGRPVD